jgi:hypothetical protein
MAVIEGKALHTGLDGADNETITGDWTHEGTITADGLTTVKVVDGNMRVVLPDEYATPTEVVSGIGGGISFWDVSETEELFKIEFTAAGVVNLKSLVRGQQWSFGGTSSTGVSQTNAIMGNTLNTGFTAYNNGVLRFATGTTGCEIKGTLAGDPAAGAAQTGNWRIKNSGNDTAADIGFNGSTDLRLRNYVHGGEVILWGQTTAGTNFRMLIADPDGGVKIPDVGNTDWAEFSHDGTDFNTTFTNTADWNITGITSIQAGTVDADFDSVTGTDFNGVPLTTAGSALSYLNEAGTYTVPAGGGGGTADDELLHFFM